jgi:hypothetical protein
MCWSAVPEGERNLRALLATIVGKVRFRQERIRCDTEFAKDYGAQAEDRQREERKKRESTTHRLFTM